MNKSTRNARILIIARLAPKLNAAIRAACALGQVTLVRDMPAAPELGADLDFSAAGGLV